MSNFFGVFQGVLEHYALMKKTILFISLISVFASNSHADDSTSVTLRQAQLSIQIEKTTFVVGDNGLPNFVRTPVCNKQGLINVYSNNGDIWSSLTPGDLRIIQCDGELFGKKVSVTVGGAVSVFAKSYAGVAVPMKNAALFLSWGEMDMETLKIVHSPTSDSWLKFQDILSPVSTGKVVDGVPQPPEPAEFFSAVVDIEDGTR